MKTIILHGELGALFGEQWELDVLTPAEAVTAIDTNRPGFIRHLIESDQQGCAYRVLLGEVDLAPEELCAPFGRETLHFVPVVRGAGRTGDANAKIIVGAVIAIASMGLGVAAYTGFETGFMGGVVEGGMFGAAMAEPAVLGMSYGTIALLGTSLMFSGISMLLAATPKKDETKDGSYVFSGAKNTTTQGGPIPIGYGELMAGSVVVSSGIQVTNEAIS